MRWQVSEVTAVAGGANHSYRRKQGADHVINYTKTGISDSEALNRIRLHGVDVVFDLIGADTLKKTRSCVKDGGKLISIAEDPGTHFPQESKEEDEYGTESISGLLPG